VAGAVGRGRAGAAVMTSAGRAALLLVVAWLLVAMALLAIQGMLLAWGGSAGALSLAVLGLRALVRQQRAPSILDRPRLPNRYRVADDLRQPITAVIQAAEAEA
jgi:hypothetical protein